MTLPLQNRQADHPLTQSYTVPNQRHPWPCRNMGQAVGRGEHGYLLCDAILRGVDCHELSVFIVLLSTGRGATIDHHLRRKAPLKGCFGTCCFTVGKCVFSQRASHNSFKSPNMHFTYPNSKVCFFLNKTPIWIWALLNREMCYAP